MDAPESLGKKKDTTPTASGSTPEQTASHTLINVYRELLGDH